MYFTSLKIANFTSKSTIHSFQSCLLYSYIDPIHEKDDVPGAIDLWNALSRDTEMDNKDTMWKVWKITQVGSLGIAGTESTSKGLVYGAGSSTGKFQTSRFPISRGSRPLKNQTTFSKKLASVLWSVPKSTVGTMVLSWALRP